MAQQDLPLALQEHLLFRLSEVEPQIPFGVRERGRLVAQNERVTRVVVAVARPDAKQVLSVPMPNVASPSPALTRKCRAERSESRHPADGRPSDGSMSIESTCSRPHLPIFADHLDMTSKVGLAALGHHFAEAEGACPRW